MQCRELTAEEQERLRRGDSPDTIVDTDLDGLIGCSMLWIYYTNHATLVEGRGAVYPPTEPWAFDGHHTRDEVRDEYLKMVRAWRNVDEHD